MSQAVGATPSMLQIRLGAGPEGVVQPGLPWLAGARDETLFAPAELIRSSRHFALFRQDRRVLGVGTLPGTLGLAAATTRLYQEIFDATKGLHLCRIWNYVPGINAPDETGLEHYRSFCLGRSRAFEDRFGSAFSTLLSAASAVGTDAGHVTVVFVAQHEQPRHLENPLQVAAYSYPEDYGPRPPSFARATITNDAVFVSGTAAIRGYLTMSPGQVRPQVHCTLENLQELSRAGGLGEDLGRGGFARHFKVYLRHAADQPDVAAILQERLLTESDVVSYVRSDICRADLMVEIEATLLRR